MRAINYRYVSYKQWPRAVLYDRCNVQPFPSAVPNELTPALKGYPSCTCEYEKCCINNQIADRTGKGATINQTMSEGALENIYA